MFTETAGSYHIEIHWSDKKLEEACSTEKAGKRRWGANFRILQRRLESLEAAETLADMDGVPGRCHALRGDRSGQFAVTLWGAYRLTFGVADDPIPRLDDGGIDRRRVTEIRVLEVVDYHGD
jgi:proteic killer suppression protein